MAILRAGAGKGEKQITVWDHYGKHDPYYGVLSIPEFRARNITGESLERFFASGVGNVEDAIHRAEAAFGPLNFGTALDYGCGVGRLTRPLAGRFAHVIAVDISRDMLEHVRQIGSNVSCEDAEAMTETPVNFILSMMVFQHIPPTVGVPILSRLAARLEGTGIIELPIRDKASRAWRALRIGKRIAKRLFPVGGPTIPMYIYDLDAVSAALGCEVKIERLDTPMFEQARLIFHSISSARKNP